VHTPVLIDAIVQRTMAFIAHLATAGGVRAPLAHVANQVFLELTQELQNQGVKKKVIADMFGMALRTYHRRVRELQDSKTDAGRTLWEVVLEFLKEQEPVGAQRIYQRFRNDDVELLSGVLNDLVNSGLAYRSGRADSAVYRLADEGDFKGSMPERAEASAYVVWLSAYRHGPASVAQLAEQARLSEETTAAAVQQLLSDGRLRKLAPTHPTEEAKYASERFDVPMGTARGWEAAVLDHFEAMVAAISTKLQSGRAGSGMADIAGGSTWSLDVWPGHPLEIEAKESLARLRQQIEDLRARVDHINASGNKPSNVEQVVVYVGQYVRANDSEVNP
jgi:hypothetical protein